MAHGARHDAPRAHHDATELGGGRGSPHPGVRSRLVLRARAGKIVDAAATAGVLLCESRRPLYAHETSNASAAGVETMKLVCTPTRAEAGPSNNWMAPRAARLKLEHLLAGSLRSSTLYVVPHVRPGSDTAPAKISIEHCAS